MIAPAILAAAALAVGHPVDVQCAEYGTWPVVVAEAQTSPTAEAFAYVNTGPVVLKQFTCRKLERIAAGREHNLDVIVDNLLVLGHELGHVAGSWDESDATCWGIVRVKQLAQALKLERPFLLRRLAAWRASLWRDEYRCLLFDGVMP